MSSNTHFPHPHDTTRHGTHFMYRLLPLTSPPKATTRRMQQCDANHPPPPTYNLGTN